MNKTNTVSMQFVKYNNVNFCIFPAPTNKNAFEYAQKLDEVGVKHIVHLAELEYDKQIFERNGITFYELSFADGGTPSSEQLLIWYKLLDNFFNTEKNIVVGIHCKASVGRAPLMIAIALIYLYGLDDVDSVIIVRDKVKYALNINQLNFLAKNYNKIKKTRRRAKTSLGCIIC